MPMLCTLASGSTGNSTLISDGRTHVLVDMGLSLKQTAARLSALGLMPGDLSAVLITHEHSDHVKGLEVLCRRTSVPVYAGAGTCGALGAETRPRLTAFETGASFLLGTLWISTFGTPHDSADPCGFRFEAEGLSVGYMTDAGHITAQAIEALSGANHIVLESNHDVGMLKHGPYPEFLKRRILSSHGHLSNLDAGRAAVIFSQRSTKGFTLAHLSRENNLPSAALEAVSSALSEAGAEETELRVAPEGMGRPVFFEGGGKCWQSASFA